MPALVSLAALQKSSVHLSGELTPEELDLRLADPCLSISKPLRYDVEAELMGEDVFVQGWLELPLDCVCVRCLEPFGSLLRMDTWSALIPTSGEEAPALVDEAVDLTPQIREDSLLALPQHPMCRPECLGLPSQAPGRTMPGGSSNEIRRGASAWGVLDTLKLD